jgi:ribosomal protein S18 acetylase RimI-like enzyme
VASVAIDVRVRPAVAADADAVVAMVQRLARFEHAPTPPRFDVTTFGRDVCGATPRLAILVAELEQRLVGCVTMFATYSTWEGRPGAHIGDLWVEPAYRASGIGRALVETAVRIAADDGARRIDVHVVRENSARTFYEKLGFTDQDGWVLYRRESGL